MRVTGIRSHSTRSHQATALSRPSRSSGILSGLCLASFLSGVLFLSPLAQISSRAQDRSENSTHTSLAVLTDLQEAFAGIADQLEPVVVTVSSTKAGVGRGFDNESRAPLVGTGTGLIVRKDGWILTNDHVVSGADRVIVKFHDGRELPGTVLQDPRSDLALVKVESKTPLPVAKLGDSDTVRIGQWAIAIGSPYKFDGTFSVGVISSLHRRQEIEDPPAYPGGQPTARLYPNMIQTDAAINPGNSGGPLCNIRGEVIAINTAIQSPQPDGGSIGIGFAIPINTAKFVMAQLLEKGKVSYGFLGISPTSVTPRQAAALKVDAGALIFREPPAESPAGKAGLHAGDVITSISGKPVKNEIDLRTIVAQTLPSTTVEIKFVRDGQPKTVSATLETAQDERDVPKPKADPKPSLGIEVEKLTDRLADQAGVPHSTLGVYVRSVSPTSSVAEEEEFGRHCIILKINDKETPTVEAYKDAIANLKSGDQVRVTYMKATPDGPIRHFAVLTVD